MDDLRQSRRNLLENIDKEVVHHAEWSEACASSKGQAESGRRGQRFRRLSLCSSDHSEAAIGPCQRRSLPAWLREQLL